MTSTNEHIPAFDGIRAVAVLLVMVFHAKHTLMPGGWIGVDIFFVLSGFLITHILTREFREHGRVDLQAFWIRRAARLLPALAALLATWTLGAFFFSQDPTEHLKIALSAGTYTMNWMRAFSDSGGGPLGHTWSLAIEMQFYLVWPFALAFLLKRRVDPLAILVAAIVGVFLWRAWLTYNDASLMRLYNGFDTRADALLIGCAFALAVESPLAANVRRHVRTLWPVACGALVVFAAFIGDSSDWIYYIGTFTVAVAAGCLVVRASENSPTSTVLAHPILQWFGRISYGIYLWHFMISRALDGWTGLSNSANRGLFIVMSILIAAISLKWIEMPVRRWTKKRLVRRLSDSPGYEARAIP